MKYTVVWRPTALQRLADLYNHAADRQSLTSAANRIDSYSSSIRWATGNRGPVKRGSCSLNRWAFITMCRKTTDW